MTTARLVADSASQWNESFVYNDDDGNPVNMSTWSGRVRVYRTFRDAEPRLEADLTLDAMGNGSWSVDAGEMFTAFGPNPSDHVYAIQVKPDDDTAQAKTLCRGPLVFDGSPNPT